MIKPLKGKIKSSRPYAEKLDWPQKTGLVFIQMCLRAPRSLIWQWYWQIKSNIPKSKRISLLHILKCQYCAKFYRKGHSRKMAVVSVVQRFGVGLVIKRSLVRLPARRYHADGGWRWFRDRFLGGDGCFGEANRSVDESRLIKGMSSVGLESFGFRQQGRCRTLLVETTCQSRCCITDYQRPPPTPRASCVDRLRLSQQLSQFFCDAMNLNRAVCQTFSLALVSWWVALMRICRLESSRSSCLSASFSASASSLTVLNRAKSSSWDNSCSRFCL